MSSTPDELGISTAKFIALKTLIADLLEYGAAAHIFTGYKTNALVNDGIIGATEYVEISSDAINRTIVNNNVVSGVGFEGAALFFDSVNTLKLQMIDEAIAECNTRYMQETDLEKRKEISKTLQALVAQKKELKRKK